MTLKVSWSIFILVQLLIYNSAQACTTDSFNNIWFGASCHYKCHCKNNVACNVTNGDCPNRCDSGWFGPACQYADIAKTASLTGGIYQNHAKITDGDDTTCAELTGSSSSFHITWTSNIYFTWLRLVVGNAELQKESISIKFPDDVTTQNVECIKVFVDKITMDIYCNISKPIRHIILNGSSVKTLCSLYISKGRNVALKQFTNQTSTSTAYSFYISSNAVDGHTKWEDNSCTHTVDSGEAAPTWTLYFQSIFTVASYTIYNRVGTGSDKSCCLDRLKGFILRTFDQTNSIVQNYTDTETSALGVYNVLSTDPWAQVSKVQITATNISPVIILSLCEVEIFGDSVCPGDKFKYGRDCENVCNCALEGEKCFVSTGNCPSGCKAGFYGQGCNKTCDAGYFGIDCRKKCSNCSGQCDSKDGNCTSCATKGKKLPYCTEDCDPGFYGGDCKSNCSRNCSQTGSICNITEGHCLGCEPGFYGRYCTSPCSSNCKDSVCDIKTGNCLSCNSGYYGKICTDVCSNNCKDSVCYIISGNCTYCYTGFYGANCTKSCPTNCKDSVCDISSGICRSCKAGFQGAQCVEECSNTTYGESCKANCSSDCSTNSNAARICDIENGRCLNGCRGGFDGLDCTTSISSESDDNDKTIIGAVAGSICGLVVLFLIGGAFFFWRRHKRSDQISGRQNTSVDNLIIETDAPDHVTSSSKLENKEGSKKVKPKVPEKPKAMTVEDGKTSEGKGTGYYNTVTLLPVTSSTVITLSNLQSYLLTHSKEYFHEQFKVSQF